MSDIAAAGTAPRNGPLAGLRIVEFDGIGPVPLAAMILADLGCEVARIARPGGGIWGGAGGLVLNRNRKVVELDLKSDVDRAQALTLIARGDGLIEGFRPGVMERLGLGPDLCLGANPKLVFARMTGWGQTGPLSQRAGHDINYIALSGALHAMGQADRPPEPPLNLVGDYGGGAMFALVGLLSALLGAQRTGQGSVIDVAMTDGTAVLTSLFHGLRASGLWNEARGTNLLDGSKPFYRCYACADGAFVAVGALEPRFFAQLLAGLGIETEAVSQYDPAGWPAMEAMFSEVFLTRSRDEWAAMFEDADACVTPVLSFAEAPMHPHNLARQTYAEVEGVVQPTPTPRFGKEPETIDPGRGGRVQVDDLLARWPRRVGGVA